MLCARRWCSFLIVDEVCFSAESAKSPVGVSGSKMADDKVCEHLCPRALSLACDRSVDPRCGISGFPRAVLADCSVRSRLGVWLPRIGRMALSFL